MIRNVLGVVLILIPTLSISGRGTAQVFGVSGAELRVNTYTTDSQSFPSIAAESSALLVTWQSSYQDGDSRGVYAQRLTLAGIAAGEFRLNTTTAGVQERPSVGAGADGRYLVVWRSQDGNGAGVFGQRASFPAPPPLPGELRFNTYTTGNQWQPAVSGSAGGAGFAVVWSGQGPVGNGSTAIWARRYDYDTTAITSVFRVNTYTSSYNAVPAVAMASSGGFVVVWKQLDDAIHGQKFLSTGVPFGGEFQANTTSSGNLHTIGAALGSVGSVVVWSKTVSPSDDDILLRLFNGAGGALGSEVRVNTHTTGIQTAPRAAMKDDDGSFVVVWESEGQDGDGNGVYAQRFSGSGAPRGREFRVNAVTTGAQDRPSVAMTADGRFAVAYSRDDGSSTGVFLQKFCPSLKGDVNASNAIDVSDVLYYVNNLFAGGPAPLFGSGDANGDGDSNVQDVLFLINYLFAGGPAPSC